MKKSIFIFYFVCLAILARSALTQESTTDEQKIAWLKDKAIKVNLNSKDFRLLDKALEDADIVLLGEISHGDGKTFTVKTELIKYLHKNLGFNVLVFESGMLECHLTWQALKNGEPGTTAFPKSIFPIWGRRTKQICSCSTVDLCRLL